ncbi:MAG: hypothetical protein AAF517_16445 [Planctomycetota bacterium]
MIRNRSLCLSVVAVWSLSSCVTEQRAPGVPGPIVSPKAPEPKNPVSTQGGSSGDPASGDSSKGDAASGRPSNPALTLSTEVIEYLRRLELRGISEDEAAIPDTERGRMLPVRVLPSYKNGPLKPHPAGYLIVRFGEIEGDLAAMVQAIAEWKPETTVRTRVRRNPYLSRSNEWWEQEVLMWLPPK